MENKDVELLNFSEVLKGLKLGKTYARSGWNGKGLSVKLETGLEDCFNGYNFNPFFIIINKESTFVNTWIPSISDLLAEDWYEII